MIDFQFIYQLVLSIFLGALMGLEREYKRKGAGLQTYSLVSFGACFFTIISFIIVDLFSGKLGIDIDPIRLIQAVVVGIGFIGAGVIFRQQVGVIGLTTAAGLWVAASIGIAVGIGLYSLAVFATFLSLLVLAGFGLLEDKIFKTKKE